MKASPGVFLLLVLCASTPAQVAPTEANLRAGVSSGGTITFNADGAILLSSPIIVDRDVVIDASGHNVTINGQNLTRLFEVTSSGRLTMTNVSLVNARKLGADSLSSSQPGQSVSGGAILNSGGTVTAVNCVFANNQAVGGGGFLNNIGLALRRWSPGGSGSGGAIAQNGGSLIVKGGAFNNNGASIGAGSNLNGDYTLPTGEGGAIYNLGGSIHIDGTLFATNTAASTDVGGGGAIFSSGGDVQIANARFERNSAQAFGKPAHGGAIIFDDGNLAIDYTYFLANNVLGGNVPTAPPLGPLTEPGYDGLGGAIYVGTNGIVTIQRSAFVQNNARGGSGYQRPDGRGLGAAIYVDGSIAAVNATFAENYDFQKIRSATNPYEELPITDGGAIFSNGSVALTNVTVLNNSANLAALTSNSGSFIIKNSLFGANSGATFSGQIIDAGNNLSARPAPFTASSSQINSDLRLGPLGDYGGPTPTVPILAGSPAINAADDLAAPATDQRGRARPFGSHSDIGAFESSPPFFVFGNVIGYHNGPVTATHGTESAQLDSASNFKFLVPEGSASFSFAGAADTLFRPLVLDVHADIQTHATAFQLEALAFDPDIATPTFTFAGKSGETWEFQASNDLAQWTSVQTKTFNADGLFSISLENLGQPVFVKAIKH